MLKKKHSKCERREKNSVQYEKWLSEILKFHVQQFEVKKKYRATYAILNKHKYIDPV